MPEIEQVRHWYPEDDPVHGFDHVMRVLRLAERLAVTEGADAEIVRAAVLLHDAEDPQTVEAERADHHQRSAQFAARVLASEGWDAERIAAVQHCIRAHRFRDRREPPNSLEAQVLFDADKLDAIGATGVARSVAYAAAAGQPFYARPSAAFLQSGQTEPGEPYSAYHEYLFKLRKLKERLYTAGGRAMAEERHTFMAQFFERLVHEIEDGAGATVVKAE